MVESVSFCGNKEMNAMTESCTLSSYLEDKGEF